MRWTFDGVMLPHGAGGRAEIDDGDPSTSWSEALPGRFALPGLVDAHAHLTVRSDHTLGDEPLARDRLRGYARGGVTLVRDVGGRSEVTLRLASHPEPGLPDVAAAGRFLAPEGRYFPRLHEPVPPDDLLAAARHEVARGATWVKLVGDFPRVDVEGSPVRGSLAPTYDLPLVRRLVTAVQDAGARVAVHTQSPHVAGLVEAGVDSVEHGEWLTDDAVVALGARGGAWTPTLAAITGVAPDSDERRRRYAHDASERLRALLPLAVRAGVRVLAGTDTAAPLTREIALLAAHGLTPTEALEAASTSAAAWLRTGASPASSIVTFDADPRDDLDLLGSPAAVVVRGRRLR